MSVINYIALIIIVLVLGFLYHRFIEKHNSLYSTDNYNSIKQYLLKDDNALSKSKKPILWIHIPYEYNARNWASFGSRSSEELNQPYLNLTVRSIIKNCEDSFHICLFDDTTFEKILPNWTIRLDTVGDPIRQYFRQLAIAKLIYTYGGMVVPISFLCFRDLTDMYNKGIRNNCMFVCDNYDANITSTTNLFYPDANFMGAPKHNETLLNFIEFMQRTISADYTAQIEFLGEFNRWCNKRIEQHKINIISGTDIGTKTINNEPVLVETLLGDDYINFYKNMYGIWIPANVILKRRHYEWFARLSAQQIFQSKFILAKYFVLAIAPDSHNGVVEPLETASPDWISFWRVPSTNGTLNVFGPKPNFLGNDVPRASNSGNMN